MYQTLTETPAPGVDLSSVTHLQLVGHATLPAGVDLSSVTHLELWDHATLPAGVDLSSVTHLKLVGHATLPAGVDLSSVTHLKLWDHATLPAGVDLHPDLMSAIPVVPDLHKRVYEAIEDDPARRLNMREWHSCSTTHCRGGWAIHLAGDAGRELEGRFGEHTAAALIYWRSTGMMPDFYATNKDAWADIQRCAGVN